MKKTLFIVTLLLSILLFGQNNQQKTTGNKVAACHAIFAGKTTDRDTITKAELFQLGGWVTLNSFDSNKVISFNVSICIQGNCTEYYCVGAGITPAVWSLLYQAGKGDALVIQNVQYKSPKTNKLAMARGLMLLITK